VSRPRVASITVVDSSLRYLLLYQLQSLQEAGYDVTGISAHGPDVDAIEAAGIRHVSVKLTRTFSPLRDCRALWQLYSVMRRERYTIVHTNLPKPGLLGHLAARLAGVPVIVHTVHGFYFHEHMKPVTRYFYITMEKISAHFADVLLSVNREDIETAVAERIVPRQKIKHLGNGIDVQRFDPDSVSDDSKAQLRREIGLPFDAPVVGFVGRLVREKGILELFRAAAIVRRQIPNARFLFVGPVDVAKPDAVWPETAAEYGLADVSYFVGMRQDTPELYSLMDVFVLPSYREGLPLSVLEAAAMKVPCVVTNVRGCREAVEHDRNGLVVELGDVEALAGAIIELLLDTDKARRMGEEGRRMVVEQYEARHVFDVMKGEYARLLEVKGIPTPQTSAG
jgi:glycosyltransferase involved in cell wall biosynthesis